MNKNGNVKYKSNRFLLYQRIRQRFDCNDLSADMDFIRHEGDDHIRSSPIITCLKNKSDKPSKNSLISHSQFVRFPLNQYTNALIFLFLFINLVFIPIFSHIFWK